MRYVGRHTMWQLLFFCVLFFAEGPLCATDLHRILQYAKANRFDLAEKECKALLKEELSDENRSLVLYNLATIYLQEGYLNEAESTFSQIDVQVIPSKTVQGYVAYNQLLCQLFLLERKITFGIDGKDPSDVYEKAIYYVQNAKAGLESVPEDERGVLLREIKSLEAALLLSMQKWKIEELAQKNMYAVFSNFLLQREQELVVSYREQPRDTVFRQALQQEVGQKLEWFLQACTIKNGAVFGLCKKFAKEIEEAHDADFVNSMESMRFLITLLPFEGDVQALIQQAILLIYEGGVVHQENPQYSALTREKKKKLLKEIIQEYKKQLENSGREHPLQSFSFIFQEELLGAVEASLEQRSAQDLPLFVDTLFQDENKSFQQLFEQKSPPIVWQALAMRFLAEQRSLVKAGKTEKAEKFEKIASLLKEAEIQYPQKMLLIQSWLQMDDKACFKELISLYQKERENMTRLKWILFAWQKQKMHYYDEALESKGSATIKCIEEVMGLQKEGRLSEQALLFISFCVKRFEYLLFFQDEFSEKTAETLQFCVQFEKEGLLVLNEIARPEKTPDSITRHLFESLMLMFHETAESFLKQAASLSLNTEQETERKELLELLALNEPSLATVIVQTSIHNKVKRFFEKLLASFAESRKAVDEKGGDRVPKTQDGKSQNAKSQELLRKNMQIQPDIARSNLLQMEEEDREKKRVSFESEVKRPW